MKIVLFRKATESTRSGGYEKIRVPTPVSSSLLVVLRAIQLANPMLLLCTQSHHCKYNCIVLLYM